MKVEVRNGTVVCVAEDWNALKNNEHKFLSQCYWTACWTDFDEDGNLTMRKCAYELDTYRTLNNILLNAVNHNVEVTDEVRAYKERFAKAASDEEARLRKIREAEMARERWENRQKNGCDYCSHCQQIGDAWFRCSYSGDELDCRIGEFWNATRGIYELFHESGVPNEHCKDYYKEEIKKSEGMRNGKI